MSSFEAVVSKIESNESLHIVEFAFDAMTLRMMSLELSEDITIGSRVTLIVKPTHIALAKGFIGEVSYSNQLPSTIQSIERGKLLCSITLRCADTIFESIITAKSAEKMHLKIGESVTALIKASELSIGEVL